MANTLRTIDVPQADSLQSVRTIVRAIADSGETSPSELSRVTGVSERHVRYRIATARVLNLVAVGDGHMLISERGRQLLGTTVGSPDETKQLRRAVEDCAIVRGVAAGLLTAGDFDFNGVATMIMKRAGLSQATAERRAQVLRSWRRQLR